MRSPITRGVLVTGLVLGVAWATPCTAATGSWSPRSSGATTQIWTRASLVRTPARSEIVPTRHQHPTPRIDTATLRGLQSRITGDQRQDRRSPSSDGTVLARGSTARLRMSAAPDRRARSAHLAVLAGIFHEAHAPPRAIATHRLA